MHEFGKNCEKFLKDVYKFSGRLSRKKFSELANKIFWIWLSFLAFDFLVGTFLEYNPEYKLLDSAYIAIKIMYGVLAWIGIIGIVIRRLHDMNRSGWRILRPIILGLLTNFLVVWMLYSVFFLAKEEGTDGANKYGEKPPDDEF